jgi:hypothetical protein
LKAPAWTGLGNHPWSDGGSVARSGLIGVDGSGAPTRRRLAALLSLAFTAVFLAFASTALAEAPPTVTIPAASEVGVTSAHLAAEVNPHGEAGAPPTYWRLELSESEEPGSFGIFGGAGEIDPPASEEANPVAVSATAENLQPDTEYFVRLVAENGEFANRAETEAPYASFTTEEATEPALTAESPTAVGYTLATLHGTVNPEGGNVNPVGGALPIHWFLQYSPEGEGAWVNAGEGEVSGAEAEGTTAIPLEATLPAGTLTQGHGYEFRTVATYLNGTREATSPGPNPTAPTIPATVPAVTIATPTVTSHTATLTGHVNPEAPEAELTSADVESAFHTTWHFQCTPECPGLEGSELKADDSAHEVTVRAAGLLAGVSYEVTLTAENSAGPVSVGPISFTTPTAEPVVEHTFVSGLTQTGATLNADVNPEGAPTTVRFQYLTLARFEVNEQSELDPFTGAMDTAESAPIESELDAGHEVSARVEGLQPGTPYVFRAVGSNEQTPAYGSPGTIARFVTGSNATPPTEACPNAQRRAEQPYGLGLPDCRAYELVSPPQTAGQDATALRAFSTARASEALGDAEPAITYAGKGSFGEPEGALLENQYLSRRTSGGWSTQAVTPLFGADATEESNSTYPTTYFTPELTAGLAVTNSRLGGAPPLGEEFGVYLAQFAGHSYQYMGSVVPREVPWGASADLDRVVLTDFASGSLFESLNGTDVPVSVTNSGETMSAAAGSPALTNEFATYKDAWHATSEDGSRVYFTSPAYREGGGGGEAAGQLYVRTNIGQPQSVLDGEGGCTEPIKACTIEVSASRREPEDPAGPKSARYWGASADGSKVFFTSDSELTEDAYTGPADNAANLYEYDLGSGELVDLTGEETDATGEGAAVQGVATISEDGSYVYFVAEGRLAAGAAQGQPNLYVSHDGGGPVFIATLGGTDKTDWLNIDPERAGPEINTAVATPAGSRLAFISERPLTGYDNRQAGPGECETELESQEVESGACREAFLYEAETGRLVCASCNPSGRRPEGPSSLQGVNPVYQAFASYRPRDLLAGGTLFFQSDDALTPGSSGGGNSVYEYEGGTVDAISTPAGGHESFFLDASPDGKDVFFGSADRLTSEDPGGNVAVWDAREGGGFPVPPAPRPCAGAESCRPVVGQAPPTGTSATATPSGGGNIAASRPKQSGKAKPDKLTKALKACRKKSPKSRRQSCERSARKRYEKKKPKSAGKNGGSNR